MERTLILDYGTVSFRVGRAGDKNPSFLVPPVVGKPLIKDTKGDIYDFSGGTGQLPLEYTIFPLNPRDKHDNVIPITAISYTRDGFEIDSKILERLLDGCMGIKGLDEGLQESSVIVSEPNRHNVKFRESFAELLTETFKVESLFLCKRSTLTCYASASTSGIVVDVGGSCINISPVSEGYVLQDSIREEPMGGTIIDRVFNSYLTSIDVTVRPSYEYCKTNVDSPTDGKREKIINKNVTIRKLPFVHSDYYHWSTLYATSILKETCIIFNDNINIIPTNDQSYCFALPDGNFLDVEQSKSLCGIFCACVFNQKKYLHKKNDLNKLQLVKPALNVNCPYNDDNIVSILSKNKGLSNLLIDSWKSLNNNENYNIKNRIIFSGGCTRHPVLVPITKRDFNDYLKNSSNDESATPIFMEIGGNEQQYSSFIGASILGSLGGFNNLCITKADVQEHGLNRSLQRKCP